MPNTINPNQINGYVSKDGKVSGANNISFGQPAVSGWQSLIPMGINLLTSLFNQRQQRRYEEELRKYNSPVEQLKRLKEAGLSTSAFFGGGTTGNTSIGTLPEVSTGNANVLRDYQSTRLTKLEQDLLTQQIRSATAEADIKEKDARDYVGSDYNKIDTKQAELQYKRLRNGLLDIETQMDNINLSIEKTLYEGGVQVGKVIEEYMGLIQKNKNLGQQYINMVTENEKTAQEITNLIATEAQTRQNIANMVTANEKMQAEIAKILTDEKYVKELTQLCYLNQDEKLAKLRQMANDLTSSEFDTAAKRIIFDDLDAFSKGQQSALGALPDALVYYGLDKFRGVGVLGSYRGRTNNTNTNTNTNTNRNFNKY